MRLNCRPIVGYSGRYLITNCGKVINGFGQESSLVPNSDGYLQVGLTSKRGKKTHKVHRLVAEAYLPNPDILPIINHKDGDKQNNCSSNLEWCTHSHNTREAFRLGLCSNEGENNPKAKLTEVNVKAILKLLDTKDFTIKLIASMFNVSESTVSDIKHKRTWKEINNED